MANLFNNPENRPFAFIFVAIMLLFSLCVVCAVGSLIPVEETQNNVYPLTTVVVALDAENDVVTCQTISGLLFEFYGVEDWQVGDIASMIMDTRGTEIVLDDIILEVKYDGWLDGWELYWGL